MLNFLFKCLLALPLLPVLAHTPGAHRRHSSVAAKRRQDNETSELDSRGGSSFYGARATYYDVGLGGCGQWNKPSDFIVALNFPMFGNVYPGPQCFKMITIEYNGKTADAQIMDACEACPAYGGIDMSTSLFTHLAGSLGPGVLSVNWWFQGSGPAPPTTSKSSTHWTTSTSWKPTTTWHSTTKATSKTSTTTHSTSSSSSTSHSLSPTAAATPAIATGPSNIFNMFQVVIGMGEMVVAPY